MSLFITDAPCHGKQYYSKYYYDYYLARNKLDDLDRFPNTDIHKTTLEKEVTKFAKSDIVLKAVKIHEVTDEMFDIMSKSYQAITNDEMEIFELGKVSNKLEFFVYQSAFARNSYSLLSSNL